MGYTLAQLQAMGAKPVQKLTPQPVAGAVAVPKKKYTIEELQNLGAKPLTKTVEQERADRIAQGLPVSVNKDRVDPTLGGNIVRGLIKAPLSVALSFPAATRGEKGVAVNSKYLGRTTDLAKGISEKSEKLAERVNKGEISLGRALAGAAGNALLTTADVASIAPVGGFLESASANTLKSVAGQTAKQTAKQLAVGAGKSFARGAGTGALYDVGAQVASGDKYNLGQTLKAGALGGVLDVGLSQVAPKVIGGTLNKGKQVYTNKLTQAGRQSSNINRVEKELINIENNYEKLRKNQKFSKDSNSASRSRVIKSGILNDVVDETGTISKIDDAIAKYREISPLNSTEGVVRQNLERLGETVDPKVVEKELVQSVYASGLEGAELRNALNNVKKEIAGYRLKADKTTGKIPLTLVHDAKISTTKGINFLTPPEVKAYKKAVASGLKTAVENNSSFNVKQVNQELSPYLQDIAYLESLAGRRVKGGKLGKYAAKITGNIVGGSLGGAIGGLPGGAIGTVIGGEISDALKGRSLSRTLSGVTPQEMPRSQVLEKAVATGKSPRLGLPSPRDEFRSVVGSGPVINLPSRTEPIYKSPLRSGITTQEKNIPIKIPQKITIPKVSNKQIVKSSNLSTLEREARKYKSADEFVNEYTAKDLMDLSNPEKHRIGRLFSEADDGKIMDTFDMSKVYGSKGVNEYKYQPDARVPDVNSPNELVTIYRGTVKKQKDILPGDFVSFSKDYALMHNNGEKLITLKVPAKDVIWQGNDLNEWVYSPESIRKELGSLEEIWKKANKK